MNKPGYITLLSVLVLGAIFTASALLLLDRGLFSSLNALSWEEELRARSATDSCVESALQEINDLGTYLDSGSLILNRSSCSYSIVDKNKEKREIYSIGIAGKSTFRIEVQIDGIYPNIVVTDWIEESSF